MLCNDYNDCQNNGNHNIEKDYKLHTADHFAAAADFMGAFLEQKTYLKRQ